MRTTVHCECTSGHTFNLPTTVREFVKGQLWQHVSWLRAKHKHWPSVIEYIVYEDKYMCMYICRIHCSVTQTSHCVISACCLYHSRCCKCVGYSDISQVNLGILAQVSTVILDPSVLSTVLCTGPVICLLSDWQAGCYSL